MKIYVASSWRNSMQPGVVHILKRCGHQVYDFRHPEPGNDGFRWLDIDPDWKGWTPSQLIAALEHPVAVKGFDLDMDALVSCDACVLVMPCGRSAHLELGVARGAGKMTAIILSNGEPELMYRMADHLLTSPAQLFDLFRVPRAEDCPQPVGAEISCHSIKKGVRNDARPKR